MREYELTVVYDLAVAEQGGADAPVEQLTAVVEGHNGKVLKVDHWGRRRLAYRINGMLDADYVVTRVDLEPASVSPVEQTLRINERVLRFLVVRADDIPAPRPPREERHHEERQPGVTGEQAAPAAEAPAATAEAPAPAAEAPAESAEAPAPAAEAPVESAPAAVEETPVEPAPTAAEAASAENATADDADGEEQAPAGA